MELLKEYEALLDAKLDPIHEAIAEMKKSQEKMITILMNQARQDETIKHIRLDVDKCLKNHEATFWEIFKIVGTIIGTLTAAYLGHHLGLI